jgi:hypothetical protein
VAVITLIVPDPVLADQRVMTVGGYDFFVEIRPAFMAAIAAEIIAFVGPSVLEAGDWIAGSVLMTGITDTRSREVLSVCKERRSIGSMAEIA